MSEVILQQTRVEQGLPYWERFIEVFPSIKDLADASEEQVLRIWQGLGYYSRARNLHATAKHITYELKKFPNTYNELLKLKGVGPYTAAAIASICFDLPHPAVDGNVFRFASRYFGIKEDISKSGTRKIFEDILSKEMPQTTPSVFNQAMMEFGAMVCTPKPQCAVCLFQKNCFAYINNLQKILPVKSNKIKTKDRFFNYIVFKHEDHYFLKKRNTDDIWKGLFDFYLIEEEKDEENILTEIQKKFNLSNIIIEDISEIFKHLLSHQKIYVQFYRIHVSNQEIEKLNKNSNLVLYSIKEVLSLPKAKLIVNYLKQIGVN